MSQFPEHLQNKNTTSHAPVHMQTQVLVITLKNEHLGYYCTLKTNIWVSSHANRGVAASTECLLYRMLHVHLHCLMCGPDTKQRPALFHQTTVTILHQREKVRAWEREIYHIAEGGGGGQSTAPPNLKCTFLERPCVNPERVFLPAPLHVVIQLIQY